MCDPVSVGLGLVGGALVNKALTPKQASVTPTTDPAADRAAAEAEAASLANRKLAEDNRRRRGQQSLLQKGAPAPGLGDTTSGADPSLNPVGDAVYRGAPRTQTMRATLMSTGAAPAASFASGGTNRGTGRSLAL